MTSELRYSTKQPVLAPRPALAELMSLALPTVAQMASYTVMQFIDTWMLSRVGYLEATAAGQSSMLAFTMLSLGFGVMMVVNTLVSQSIGRGDKAACGQFLWQGVWTAMGLGLLALPLLLFAAPIFGLLGHPPHLTDMEASFFRITVGFSAVKLCAMALGQFTLAIQRPNITLLAAVCGVCVNATVNWFLIFGRGGFPAMGVSGAAWGTNCGVLVELAVLVAFVSRPAMRAQFNTGDWKLRLDKLKKLLVVGIPSGVQVVAEVAAWTLFTVWVMARFSPEVMAANNFTFRYMSVSFMPAFGFSTAVTALVGRYIGAGRPDLAAQRAHLGFVVTACYMLCCGALFFAFRKQLIGVFTTDPDVLRAGETLLIFAAIYQFFDAMYIIYNGALRGAGDTFVPAVVTTFLCWTMTVGGGFAVAYYRPDWGPAGPWSVGLLYGIVLSAFLFTRFSRGTWRKINLEEREALPLSPVLGGEAG